MPLKTKSATDFFKEHFVLQFNQSIDLDILDLTARCEDELLNNQEHLKKPNMPRLTRVVQLQNQRI